MTRATRRRTRPYFLACVLAAWVAAPGGAHAAAATRPSLAIVSDPALRTQADLLTVELTKLDAVNLLERDAID